jgi:ribonucleoside-diphosphate reductase alpha chain
MKILSKKLLEGEHPVWDIEVEKDHYYLLENGVISHNSSSILCGNTSPSIEPWAGKVFNQITQTGNVTKINPQLEALIRDKHLNGQITGKWAKTKKADELVSKVSKAVGRDRGSVKSIDFLTDNEKYIFRTALEISQSDIIILAGHRQEFIDQTQSLNLFYDSGKTSIPQMYSDIILAWTSGVCTLYYQRGVQSVKRDKVGEKVEKPNLMGIMMGHEDIFTDDADEVEELEITTASDCLSCEG